MQPHWPSLFPVQFAVATKTVHRLPPIFLWMLEEDTFILNSFACISAHLHKKLLTLSLLVTQPVSLLAIVYPCPLDIGGTRHLHKLAAFSTAKVPHALHILQATRTSCTWDYDRSHESHVRPQGCHVGSHGSHVRSHGRYVEVTLMSCVVVIYVYRGPC